MRDSKTFEARSSIRFTPRKEHHNQTYRCEAWNEAGDNLRPALARLFVEYAPSVTVTPVRPGMIQEGDKVLILRLTYIILAKGFYLVAHGLCTRSPSIMAFFVQYAPSVTSVVVRPFSSLCLGWFQKGDKVKAAGRLICAKGCQKAVSLWLRNAKNVFLTSLGMNLIPLPRRYLISIGLYLLLPKSNPFLA